jgi:hypothetical protein
MCLKVVIPKKNCNMKKGTWSFEATNEMILNWPFKIKKNGRLMWFEGEPIFLISLVRGHVHNDDGSIWDVYYVEKQVYWDFFHRFNVGVVSPKALCGIQINIVPMEFFYHGNCYH